MASEERRKNMARKKENDVLISEEDSQEVQHILDTYQQIAAALHSGTTQAQAEAALQPINALSEAAQLATVKALAKTNETRAADVLVAVNAFSPQKEVRKEARRGLLRLETAKIYPRWTAPIAPAIGIQVAVTNPPHFWKGFVTQTREEGELQLHLVWEQGYEYSEARSIIFLLEFWNDGVKDVIVETSSKRRVDERMTELRTKMSAPITDCTLAEGKRLLEEALSINTWRGTAPAKEYRNYQSIIKQLIMQASDAGVDRGKTFINPELTDQESVVNFLGGWSFGDFGLAYDLLTRDSTNREGLERSEWIEQRRTWMKEANPVRLELGFVHEREQSQQQSSGLWLPSSPFTARSAGRKDIEVGWSLELLDTPLNGTIRELPMGTAINKDTNRHWFWTTYTLVKQDDGWRIQRISDEGANIQGLSIEELQKRIKDYDAVMEEAAKRRNENVNEFMQELSWRLTQVLHFYDALIVRLPLDRQVCEDAYGHAVATGNTERTQVYLERIATRFGENKVDTLRRLGATLATTGFNYDRPEMHDRQRHFLERAEAVLREVLSLDDSALNHTLLAELFLAQQRNDEAEAELLQAKTRITNTDEEASIEVGLGNIAMRRELINEALTHFERVEELKPNYTGIWFSIGFARRMLGQLDAAAEAYQRAIVAEPRDIRPYSELVAVYMNQDKRTEARRMAEQGVQANPDSPQLHAIYSSVLFELGDTRHGMRELEVAERLDPQDELVRNVRQYVEKNKKK